MPARVRGKGSGTLWIARSSVAAGPAVSITRAIESSLPGPLGRSGRERHCPRAGRHTAGPGGRSARDTFRRAAIEVAGAGEEERVRGPDAGARMPPQKGPDGLAEVAASLGAGPRLVKDARGRVCSRRFRSHRGGPHEHHQGFHLAGRRPPGRRARSPLPPDPRPSRARLRGGAGLRLAQRLPGQAGLQGRAGRGRGGDRVPRHHRDRRGPDHRDPVRVRRAARHRARVRAQRDRHLGRGGGRGAGRGEGRSSPRAASR